MDCASSCSTIRVRTVPMHRVRMGDRVVVGNGGVRVHPLERPRRAEPVRVHGLGGLVREAQGLLVAQVAERIRDAQRRGGAGARGVRARRHPHRRRARLARLVRGGIVDVLFAGNGFAAHDIEANVLGTSLGVNLTEGRATEHGHSNHLRVINEVRRRGSIANAVADGFLSSGVMYECVIRGVPFVLGGSVRDDGPLPDVHTDVVAAADAMRAQLPGVAVALMLATTLHAIATGNLPPGGRRDRSASTSTRPSSPSSPTAAAIRPSASSPTSACSSATSPTTWRVIAGTRRELALSWGRRYLMCPPEHFGVLYEINPWMHRDVKVDPSERATSGSTWSTTLRAAGAEVDAMEPQPDLPDLVFTANAGIVNGDQFVPSRFRHPERQAEAPLRHRMVRAARVRRGRAARGRRPRRRRRRAPVPRPVLLCRLPLPQRRRVARPTSPADRRRPVRSMEAGGRRGSTTSTSPSARSTTAGDVAPDGWDSYGRKVVEALVPEPLALGLDDALRFCANSVVVGTNVVMPSRPPAVGRRLEAWGFDVAVSPVDEFLKAGGGCRCLTLALDVVL